MDRSYEYACVAGSHGGIVRCRNLATKGSDFCPTHPGNSARAPAPDRVLVKINLNPAWDARFEKVGVPTFERMLETAERLRTEREARARQLGRDPLAIRRERAHDISAPESADSGTPVFGIHGLAKVAVESLTDELERPAVGLRITRVYRLTRRYQHGPKALVMEFSRDTPLEESGITWETFFALLREATDISFGQVDVLANPRDERHGVVHTVNCGGERTPPASACFRLRFAGGDWGADPLEGKEE